MPRDERAHRVAARILRTAATQTVLTQTYDGNMTFLEAVPSSDGLRITESLSSINDVLAKRTEALESSAEPAYCNIV